MHNILTNMVNKNQNAGKNTVGYQRNFGSNGNNFGYGNFNTGGGQGQNGNINTFDIICQICFAPGHDINKCKNKYNPAFTPQINYARGTSSGGFRPSQGQYGRGNSGFRPFTGYGNKNYGPQFTGGFPMPRGSGY